MAAEDILGRCIKEFEADEKSHAVWVDKVEKWYRAWRGIMEPNSKAAEWRNSEATMYAFQIVETLVAGLLDPNPRWDPKPRQRLESDTEVAAARAGAKALEILLSYQRDIDGMLSKQRVHRLQGAIAGLTVWKAYWAYHEVDDKVLRDDPCVEVVDVRDFIWHEAARDIPTAARVFHRFWRTYEQLEGLQKDGYYKNVSELKESRDFSSGLSDRENDLFEADRTKDMIECLECWIDNGQRVVTIANRKVVLRDKPNPFDHKQYPFMTSSPMPDLFRIPGVSIVELVEPLQKMVWSLQNQRLDNLELINNLVLLKRDDVLQQDVVLAPGEVWTVPDKEAITALELPTFPAQISIDAEAMIKADIQNIPGASPALLGQSGQAEQTATEVSLMTNLAQRRLAMMKQNFTIADIAVGDQWIELNQQFLKESKYVSIVGAGGEDGWHLIHPQEFADYTYKIDVSQMDESLIRQERIAEAMQRFQVMGQAAPLMAAIGKPVNMVAFLEDILEAAGIQDKARYLSATPQPMAPTMGGAPGNGAPGAPLPPQVPGAPTGPPMPGGMGPEGGSPVGAIQQMMAMNGGAANAPQQ